MTLLFIQIPLDIYIADCLLCNIYNGIIFLRWTLLKLFSSIPDEQSQQKVRQLDRITCVVIYTSNEVKFPLLWEFWIYNFSRRKLEKFFVGSIVNIRNECLFYTPVFRRDVLWYGDVRPSVRVSVRPSVRPSVRHSFPHFPPTCFDILIWNFVYHFIFMHVRWSSNAINFRHFLQELCSFLTSNSYKYAVFRTFLLHALTYWVQILYMTLF